MVAKDLTNKVFNNWTVLHRHGNYRGCAVWKCRCKCGTEKDLRSFHLTRGYSKQCRKCAYRELGLKKKSHFKNNEANFQFWNRYVLYGATKRNIKVLISLEEANNMFQKQNGKCAITGLSLSFPEHRKDTNSNASLDRIDSNKDYTVDNVQWVHKDVNKMKNDFSLTRFKEICKLVTDFGTNTNS